MSAKELPMMIVTDDPSSAALPATHVWRQITGLSVAWVGLLVSLIAVPGVRVFTLIAFVGMLFVVGVSWACASRAEPDAQGRPVGPPNCADR